MMLVQRGPFDNIRIRTFRYAKVRDSLAKENPDVAGVIRVLEELRALSPSKKDCYVKFLEEYTFPIQMGGVNDSLPLIYLAIVNPDYENLFDFLIRNPINSWKRIPDDFHRPELRGMTPLQCAIKLDDKRKVTNYVWSIMRSLNDPEKNYLFDRYQGKHYTFELIKSGSVFNSLIFSSDLPLWEREHELFIEELLFRYDGLLCKWVEKAIEDNSEIFHVAMQSKPLIWVLLTKGGFTFKRFQLIAETHAENDPTNWRNTSSFNMIMRLREDYILKRISNLRETAEEGNPTFYVSESDRESGLFNLLMFAVNENAIKVIECLLPSISKNDFEQNSLSDQHVFFLVRSVEAYQILREKVAALGLLETVILSKLVEPSISLLGVAICHRSAALVEHLIKTEFPLIQPTMLQLLHISGILRLVSWNRRGSEPQWEKILLRFREMYMADMTWPIYEPVEETQDHWQRYCKLYGENSDNHASRDFFGVSMTSEHALEKTFTVIQSIFESPDACLPYLARLNKMFEEYYLDKYKSEFPTLDKSQYQFGLINGLLYPRPGADYKGIEKRSALQAFLIALLQKHGLQTLPKKWFGLISTEILKKELNHGNIPINGMMGPTMLMGKCTHLIQVALVILLLEDGKLPVEYAQEGAPSQSITIKDIVLASVRATRMDPSRSIWEQIFCKRDYNYPLYTFSSPHFFHSYMMLIGKQNKVRAIADSLIDSTCSQLRFYFNHYNENKSGENIDQFFDELDHLSLRRHTADLSLSHKTLCEQISKSDLGLDSVECYGQGFLLKRKYSRHPA